MNDIEKYSLIKSEALDSYDYFLSLLKEAAKLSLLNEGQAEKIQYDCLELLAQTTRRYTGMDSSSVRIETAQELLDSLLFTIGLGLKAFPTPDDALSALLSDSIPDIFKLGRTRINRLLSHAKTLHASLMANLFQTPNEFYSSTIIGGICGFFKLYRPDYFAHDAHITADYPVLSPQSPLHGVEFIRSYLHCLCMENAFLTLFEPSAVHCLLLAYDCHYAQLPINLCEPVLCVALGCILTHESPLSLHLSFSAAKSLSCLFINQTETEIELRLEAALAALRKEFELPSPIFAYFRTALPQISLRVLNASLHGSLEKLFPVV